MWGRHNNSSDLKNRKQETAFFSQHSVLKLSKIQVSGENVQNSGRIMNSIKNNMETAFGNTQKT